MCDQPATGVEHVPPKCFFPEKGGFRRNLITVPSCSLHNSKKSTDDEYLRHVLVTSPGTNNLALNLLSGPVMRSYERRPHILNTFFPNFRELPANAEGTAAFQIDLERFESTVGAVVRALYFHRFAHKLSGKFTISWAALRARNLDESEVSAFMHRIENFAPARYRSPEPRVFKYSFESNPHDTLALCRLRFYDGLPIYVIWQL